MDIKDEEYIINYFKSMIPNKKDIYLTLYNSNWHSGLNDKNSFETQDQKNMCYSKFLEDTKIEDEQETPKPNDIYMNIPEQKDKICSFDKKLEKEIILSPRCLTSQKEEFNTGKNNQHLPSGKYKFLVEW